MSYLAMPVALDVVDTSATINPPGSPAPLVVPTINQVLNCGYDNTTGVVTLLQSCTYTFEFQFLSSSLLGGRMNFFAEADTGSGFQTIMNSGRTDFAQILTNKMINFGATRYFAQGTKLRCNVYGSGFTLNTFSLPGVVGVVCPAIRITMTN